MIKHIYGDNRVAYVNRGMGISLHRHDILKYSLCKTEGDGQFLLEVDTPVWGDDDYDYDDDNDDGGGGGGGDDDYNTSVDDDDDDDNDYGDHLAYYVHLKQKDDRTLMKQAMSVVLSNVHHYITNYSSL
ncbi:hypothetical protein PoB_004997500 [Plakobranchus ocellatus]|uniref:Uncharacterized protein n=1 Tax=Plakobranchus ocellatus TaxID=259542 RepID=A0AAV4BSN6_9GAST|nr:hypothetical protein PoB_004997500 [Plakobranchus ocellatus]